MKISILNLITYEIEMILSVVLRVILAATLGLTDDEAWYWGIAQQTQLSYVVHPPLSMWLLRLSTLIFGHHVWAVRLPAVLCFAWGTFYLSQLATAAKLPGQESERKKGVQWAVTTAPLLYFGSVLIGPDQALFVCWSALLLLSYKLSQSHEDFSRINQWRWVQFGVWSGFAILSKYTGILAVVAGLLSLFTTAIGRRQLKSKWPLIALFLAAAIFSPVIYWNMNNDWASFVFQFWNRHEGSEINIKRWLLFIVSQFLLMGPALFISWFVLFYRGIVYRQNSFFWIWSVVPACVFFVQPLFSPFKIHWALFAFVPLIAMSTILKSRLKQFCFITGALLTLIGTLAFYIPLIPSILPAGRYNADQARNDVTNDVYGWDLFAVRWQSVELPVRGWPIVASRYQIAAQAAYALKDSRKIMLTPNNRLDYRDWPHYQTLPQNFIFITDNRFEDSIENQFSQYQCQDLFHVEVKRGGYFAKRISVQVCHGIEVANIKLRLRREQHENRASGTSLGECTSSTLWWDRKSCIYFNRGASSPRA